MAVPAHGHWPLQLERRCPRQVGGCRCSMCTLGVWATGVNRTLVLLELELDHARPVSPVNRRESNQSSLRGGGPRLPLPPGTIRTMGRERGLGSCNSPLLISPARQARRSALDSSAGQSVRWGGSEGWALVTRFFSSRSEEHTSELQSRGHLVCRLLLEKKKKPHTKTPPTIIYCY